MAFVLKVIIGSTRPGRIGPTVAAWVNEAAKEHDAFDVKLVDLAEVGLPLLDEPDHPAKQNYQHEHTKRWSAIIDEADAFVFVTPEYDFFAPASLVNAVQTLSKEWKYKPAVVVCYGGVSGGLRSAQELRQLLGNVGVVALPQTVPAPFVFKHIEDGKLTPNDPMRDGLNGALDELAKWTKALKTMRD
ncbi:MAG: NAD(P)H-dependent oxidoreductase [Myxococcales bacterium]|nr:NAD(P)H-dependent oxidoreductase [Myxococcales bacterium]